MDIFHNLIEGFAFLFSNPILIASIAAAVAGGLAVGALPGLTATMAMALVLPFTFYMGPELGISVLMGLFSGGIAGGAITAILLNVPGTPASAATTLDGYQMTRKGRAGEALGLAVLSGGIGGVFAAIIMSIASPIIARFALNFQAPEFFVLAIYGITIIAAVSGKSLLKGYISGLIGLVLGIIGLDPITAVGRMTFGNYSLYGGLNIVPVLIGLFGIAQILTMARWQEKYSKLPDIHGRFLPRKRDLKRAIPNWFRSASIGTAIGVVPGTGTDIGAFLSYSEAEKRRKKDDPEFGKGNPQGVVAPETANNAVVGGSMIPTFTLGIPGEAGAAVLLGGLMIHGITPGPQLLLDDSSSKIMYIIFASFITANILMVFIELMARKVFMSIVRIPINVIIPLIAMLCMVGAYSMGNSVFDMWITLITGFVGYVLVKNGFPVSPIILGLILGPMAETNFRRAMIASSGDWTEFFTRPFSLLFWALIILSLLYQWRSKKKSQKALEEKEESLSPSEKTEPSDTSQTQDN